MALAHLGSGCGHSGVGDLRAGAQDAAAAREGQALEHFSCLLLQPKRGVSLVV